MLPLVRGGHVGGAFLPVSVVFLLLLLLLLPILILQVDLLIHSHLLPIPLLRCLLSQTV